MTGARYTVASPDMDHALKIWHDIIQPDVGVLPSAVIRHALSLNSLDEYNARFHLLSMNARAGTITPEEASELQVYSHAFAFVRCVKAKACRSLEQMEPAEGSA